MKLSKITGIAALLLICSSSVKAQDPHYTQFFSNSVIMNPAFTGTAGCSRIISNFRDQWPEMTGNYITSTLSYDQYIHPMRSSLGFTYVYDNAGDGTLQSHGVNLTYAFPIKLKEDMMLSLGLNTGTGCRLFNWNDNPSFGPYINPTKDQKFYFNLGLGGLFSYKNLTAGFSFDHINRPDIGFITTSRLPVNFKIHASNQFNLGQKATLTPTLLFMNQENFYQVLPAVIGTYSFLKFGAGTRFSDENFDAVFGILGYQNSWMSISYSYDVTVSSLSNRDTGGSHEISAAFKFNCKNKTDKFHLPQVFGF